MKGVSKVLDDMNRKLHISDEEIAAALEQNTRWQGVPGQMWSQIEARVQPVPWYKLRRSWMPAFAAVMVLVIILVTQNNLPPQQLQPTDLGTDKTEMMQSESTIQHFRTMSAFDQPLFDQYTYSQVAVEVGFEDVVAAGADLKLDLDLTAAQGVAFTMETPIIRLVHTDKDGLVTIVTELSIDSWNQQTLIHGKPLSGTIELTAPDQPGSYLVEVSISGSIDGQPVFFGETKNLSVIEKLKEE